jgi:hypothetical protein
MNIGILPEDRLEDRAALLAEPNRLRPLIPGMRARMNELLGGGKLSYASVPLDGVDWGPFDIISTEAGYRTAERAARFRDDIRAFVAQGRAQRKPVAITEFGCAAFRGAADLADRGDIVEWGDGARPVRFKGEYARDEDEQARYLGELLDVFEAEGVDNVFVYTFARYDLARRTKTSTSQAPAWLKCSRDAVVSGTPICLGSPKPHSPRSPNTIVRSTVIRLLTSLSPFSWSRIRK